MTNYLDLFADKIPAIEARFSALNDGDSLFPKLTSLAWRLAVEFPFDNRKADTPEHLAAQMVLADLSDRRGFRQVMDDLDESVRLEIVDALTLLIFDGMRQRVGPTASVENE